MKIVHLQSNKFLDTFTDGALITDWEWLFQSLMALTAKNDDLTLDEILFLYSLRLLPLVIKEVLRVSQMDLH